MFLTLNHQKLEAYNWSKRFVIECYRISNNFPSSEKFGMASQIRRAALSVHLNIAEGSSRKSLSERKRYYEIARGSIIEVDAAIGIANELGYLNNIDIPQIQETILKCFKLLTGLLRSTGKTNAKELSD